MINLIKFYLLTFAFLILNASTILAEDNNTIDTNKALKIGVAVALTGPLGPIGTTIKNAITLASETYDPDNKVHFIFEDDGFQPKNTVTIVNKFLSTPPVDAIIVFGSNTTLSVTPLTESKKIPLISFAVLDNITENKNHTFRFFPSISNMNQATIIEMKRRGYKRLAVLATVQEATLGQRDLFINSGEFEIPIQEEVLPTDTDFRTLITRIKSHKIDAIYAITLPPQGSLFIKQLRQMGYAGDVVTGLQTGSPAEIAAAGDALKGAWYATGDDTRATDFYLRYNNKFPQDPSFSESVYAYELARLLIAAVKQRGITDYLKSIKNSSGVLGQYSSDGKGSFDFAVTIKEFK